MVRDLRVKEYTFLIGSLTASAGGLFDIYSDHTINGTIQSITLGSNTFTNTGSLSIFISGTDNIAQNDLIMRLRAGSIMKAIYPLIYPQDNQMVIGSATSAIPSFQNVSNAPIRVVGSGLGNATSGLYLTLRYI